MMLAMIAMQKVGLLECENIDLNTMVYTQVTFDRRVSGETRRVLVVDDDAFNLEILQECLSRSGDAVTAAESGLQAVELLLADPFGYDILLLDRMMPHMSGIEVFQQIQSNERLQHIPVVMQTAAATVGDIESGLASGILYYLSKPYNRTALFNIMSTAIRDATLHTELRQQVASVAVAAVPSDPIEFRTMEEVKPLALQLAVHSSAPEKAVVGLYELMSNAVEHGLYGISYDEKTQLVQDGQWQQELNARSLNCTTSASVALMRRDGELLYRIQDQGTGFDSRDYLSISPKRATDNHGRGIAIARRYCFDRLEFNSRGNTVTAAMQS